MIENLITATEHLAGFFIVLLMLCLLWGGTALIGRIFGGQSSQPGATRLAVSHETLSQVGSPSDEISDELVAVYAAVAALLDHKHRIVTIRSTPSSWGAQGRSEIHASHRIR